MSECHDPKHKGHKRYHGGLLAWLGGAMVPLTELLDWRAEG